jgi:hypothetical protein
MLNNEKYKHLFEIYSAWRCLWPVLSAHTAQALVTGPVSAAITNAGWWGDRCPKYPFFMWDMG